jgi:hypothetical protein
MKLSIQVTKDKQGEYYAAVVTPRAGYPNGVQEVWGVGSYGTEAEAREELVLSLAEELTKLRGDVMRTCESLSRDLAALRKA